MKICYFLINFIFTFLFFLLNRNEAIKKCGGYANYKLLTKINLLGTSMYFLIGILFTVFSIKIIDEIIYKIKHKKIQKID